MPKFKASTTKNKSSALKDPMAATRKYSSARKEVLISSNLLDRNTFSNDKQSIVRTQKYLAEEKSVKKTTKK